MIKTVETLLLSFRKHFSREGCFKWFVVSVFALMLRGDKLGITSVIRDLDLSHKCYENLLHFFRSRAFSLSSLREQWYITVRNSTILHRVNGRAVLVGDGVKQSKEALKMPGVKKMVQESETCSKKQYIHGHMFGQIGIIITNLRSRYCLPLKSSIQDGLRAMAGWPEAKGIMEISDKSHVEQIIESAFEAAKVFRDSYLLLDRYFLTRPALILLNALNSKHRQSGDDLIVMITKAKANCIAYRHPRRKTGSKGRPPRKGKSVKLAELFSQKRFFAEATIMMYGVEETVSYCCLNLLWGQKLYQELRFVLVSYRSKRTVLVSTDTSLDPLTIISLYSTRFSIEETFREFKQQIGGFCYRFWTKSLPKLNHFAKKGTDLLEGIVDSTSRIKIVETARAIEIFVFCGSVALGILQIIALDKRHRQEVKESRYLRTYSKDVPSEASVMYYLRKKVFLILSRNPHSFVTEYIREKQIWGFEESDAKTA